MMKQIGDADRDTGCARFDGCEGGMIVDDGVGEQSLVAAAAAKIEGGRIIEAARNGDAGKEPVVFFIPEAMRFSRRLGVRAARFGGAGLGSGGVGPGIALLLREERVRTEGES